MALYLEERQIQTWQFSKKFSVKKNVEVALLKMASFRQAAVTKSDVELYSSVLVDLDIRAFQVAMAILSERPREQGETGFPSLGTILEIMEEARERYTSPRKPKLNTLPLYEGAKLLDAGK